MLKPVYYIYGNDDYLIEEEVSAIKKEALTGGFASMNYQAFEGKGLTSADIVAAASTMPAFADWRVVLVKGADSLKSEEEKNLIDYIKDPSPTTVLVMVAEKIEKTSLFYKALNEKGYLKACNRLSERELSAWVKKEAKKQGKAITDAAAEKLVQITGTKLREIKGELEKITLYAWDKAEIDVADVEDAGLDCREETIFGLSDAIGSKDVKKALKAYDRVSGEEPLKILGAVSRQIRTLLKIKALLRKKVPGKDIPAMAGVPPYYLENYVARARKFTEGELEKAIGKLNRADTDLKTGRAPNSTVLPRVIMELCGGK